MINMDFIGQLFLLLLFFFFSFLKKFGKTKIQGATQDSIKVDKQKPQCYKE